MSPTNPSTLLQGGLSAPICLTWELTYACNLSCTHCLSSSGRRDPKELSTTQCKNFIDELSALKVFYVNIGGGEPTYRSDFIEVVEHALRRRVGVKFSTNGFYLDHDLIGLIKASDYLDLQISLDGANAEVNDAIRGAGTFARVLESLNRLKNAGVKGFKISVVVTNGVLAQLDDLLALANHFHAELRLTRLRPSGRGALTWDALRLRQEDQSTLHRWLVAHPEVLTGDSFFHLSPLGGGLQGLNMCGAGRVVCLVDPIGDVYACPFTIHPDFLAGSLNEGSFADIWNSSPLFQGLRHAPAPSSCASCRAYQTCQGGCMASKYFNGLSYNDPDPECVFGHGERLVSNSQSRRSPDLTHSTTLLLGPRRPSTTLA